MRSLIVLCVIIFILAVSAMSALQRLAKAEQLKQDAGIATEEIEKLPGIVCEQVGPGSTELRRQALRDLGCEPKTQP